MKKSVKIAIIAIVAVLVVAGALTAVFWSNISNMVAKTTKTPEEYYVYVEKQNLETTTSTFYSLLNLDSKKEFKEGSKFSLKLEAGDGVSDITSLIFGSSEGIEWFKNVEFSGTVYVSNNGTHGGLNGILNGKTIFESSIVTDMKNENLYFGIPVVTGDKFIKLSLADVYGDLAEEENESAGFLATLDQETINNILPTEKVFAELLVKYFNVLVNNLGEAEQTTDNLEIDGITQACTLITLKVDEKDFYNGIRAVLNEVKIDKEIEKIVRAYAAEIKEDPDQLMDDFVKSVFFAIEEINMRLDSLSEKSESEIADEEVTLKTWVDNKGNVVARKIFVEEKELFFGNVKKGKELATDVYFKEGDKVIAEFSGKGTLKGDKLSGSYSVEYEGKEFVKVNVADFDLGALEDDCELYGKFNVSVGSGLMEVISEDEENVPDEILDLIKTAEINFNFSEKAFTFEIATKGKTCIKLSATETEIDYAEPVIPEESKTVDMEDEEALGEMLMNFDVQSILDKLVEAGVPQELIDSLTATDDYDDEWGGEDDWEDFEDFEDFEDNEGLEDF